MHMFLTNFFVKCICGKLTYFVSTLFLVYTIQVLPQISFFFIFFSPGIKRGIYILERATLPFVAPFKFLEELGKSVKKPKGNNMADLDHLRNLIPIMPKTVGAASQ